ncbi:hypothetical protein BV509_09135 [Rhodovulum sulfidophilum]|uniref:DUF2116 family Zn-ribbon domain-containing protein n=1 Tax=Rhodovulum visakhapatnamense TaxID=364297 RepID=A0ABS1RLN0_9RHOB|nr:hypothetical protein [Rhodovulum visakhapatnamense]MBL3568873.1 hypothetical protein [Rhodovulum visakhapatnamense]MBL3579792.1 hypothetical protein [Rhodovulum visakhapatnamense]OLS44487.1 hypothetical protein BV509_09135 [Rhodovulum sulfidophilum]
MTRRCERCGAPIPGHKRADAVYCSKTCKNTDYGEILAAGRIDDKRDRAPCLHCGAPIPPEAPANRRFCSITCQRLARRVRDKAARVQTCPVCGKTFNASIPDQTCCSHACAAVYRREAGPRPCQCCGKEIPAPLPEQKWCSSRCRERAWKIRRRKG